MNDNGVPIRMILINIFRPSFGNEDPSLLVNAVNGTDPYEFVGTDSDANNRELRPTYSFNYFRLGAQVDAGFGLNSGVQRRIVIANGSTQELLFSMTPVGTNDGVQSQIEAERQTILDAINSVELTPEIPENLSIDVSELQVNGNTINLQFTSAPGLTGFTILGSTSLTDEFPLDLTKDAVVTESENSPGTYNTVIDRSDLPESLFICVQF